MRKILLFGSSGMLGGEVRRLWGAHPASPQSQLVCLTSTDCDLTNTHAVAEVFERCKPDVVINCAAYTAVDKAEAEPGAADALNHVAVACLADSAKRCGALLIHVSTDYVFDGTIDKALVETDPVNPLGVYGMTKLRGEEVITASGCAHLIVRTQWLYAHTGKNFFLTMLRLFAQKDEIGVVDDQWGVPTSAANLAKALIILAHADVSPRQYGIYHYSDSGSCTWFDFACRIAQISGARCRVRPITTAQYPTPAHRPAHSLLSHDKIVREFGVTSPAWQDALDECYALWQQL